MKEEAVFTHLNVHTEEEAQPPKLTSFGYVDPIDPITNI
jgi:hypothetical protein